MTEYTPTTEEVQGNYAEGRADFQRWLNQVKAEAWDEGNNQAWQDCENGAEFGEPNPYRKEQ